LEPAGPRHSRPRIMTPYKYKCQQCGLVVEMTREHVQATGTLKCPECAKAGIECALVPTCGIECANGGTCGCAVPGFVCG
jgi:DNA-directed RNA polymerase subunit RPC12/RpoP